MSGVTPVSGSSVKLWGAGTTGYGTGATQLGATATSAADGSFSIALASCPSANAQIYLTAKGGNAGGGINISLMMIAALGPCGSISFSTAVIINEVTTAGSVYALSQFLSTTSSGIVGAPATNAAGQADAFANAANLINVASGSALSTTPQQNLNSIANALAACVQTSGSSSANCTELFDCALPGAVFGAGACSGGTGSVADTLAANLSIALNPALVSVAGVNDVAIDSSGRVWVTNVSGGPSGLGTVTALNNDGSFYLNNSSDFDGPGGVAIDSTGVVWVTNSMGNTITALHNNGTLIGDFHSIAANFNSLVDIAIDSSGNLWVTNSGGDTLTELSIAGFIFHNFAPDRVI